MIKYKLICKNCDIFFDSWFASSKEYEKLKKLKYVNCHNCNSLDVEKTLMSPNILNNKKNTFQIQESEKFLKVKNKIRKYQKFIENNFEYVGKNFAHEARLIHYNDKKKSKGIYGDATIEEVKELKEEGIETEALFFVNKKDN